MNAAASQLALVVFWSSLKRVPFIYGHISRLFRLITLPTETTASESVPTFLAYSSAMGWGTATENVCFQWHIGHRNWFHPALNSRPMKLACSIVIQIQKYEFIALWSYKDATREKPDSFLHSNIQIWIIWVKKTAHNSNLENIWNSSLFTCLHWIIRSMIFISLSWKEDDKLRGKM